MKKNMLFLMVLLLLKTNGTIKKKPNNLVEICKINPNIALDIRYATTNNFTGQVLYSQPRCFFVKETAEKINNVQKELETLGLGLKIFDGYRPYCTQCKLYDAALDKRYVANPYQGGKPSKHCLGCAVDCTLIYLSTGKEVEMPSKFDEFSPKAHRDYKKMSKKAAKNCKLLELIMAKHGFGSIYHEWWHFNDLHYKKYSVLNIDFSEIN